MGMAAFRVVKSIENDAADRIVELAPRMAVNIEVLLHKYGGIR